MFTDYGKKSPQESLPKLCTRIFSVAQWYKTNLKVNFLIDSQVPETSGLKDWGFRG
jgi:hypothetical protein